MPTYVPTKAESMSQQGTSDDPPPPSPSSTSQGCCQFRHFTASFFAYRPRPGLLATLLAQPGSIASAVSSYASATVRSVTIAMVRLTSIWMSSPSHENLMGLTRHPKTMAGKPFTSFAGGRTYKRQKTKKSRRTRYTASRGGKQLAVEGGQPAIEGGQPAVEGGEPAVECGRSRRSFMQPPPLSP